MRCNRGAFVVSKEIGSPNFWFHLSDRPLARRDPDRAVWTSVAQAQRVARAKLATPPRDAGRGQRLDCLRRRVPPGNRLLRVADSRHRGTTCVASSSVRGIRGLSVRVVDRSVDNVIFLWTGPETCGRRLAVTARACVTRSAGRTEGGLAMTNQTVEVPQWVIECTECGKLDEGPAERWKAYLDGGFGDLPPEAAAFCPTCAARELEDGSVLT